MIDDSKKLPISERKTQLLLFKTKDRRRQTKVYPIQIVYFTLLQLLWTTLLVDTYCIAELVINLQTLNLYNLFNLNRLE